ncbi:hypothetical protein [Arthrobacter bussei]|uniref:hypothetical protein n=1 Tax=Arthrobacter bussei TaxID=2594179 RepID=UPI0019D6504E|nr:hypothetical protein [Arthrobacter bussei]
MAMHEDQLEVSAATVRQLVLEQFPQWSHETVEPVVAHWNSERDLPHWSTQNRAASTSLC